MHLNRLVSKVFREDGRRVLAGLIRLTGDIDHAEDALQEACARALVHWKERGVPDQPGAWLNTVARRVALDRMRRDRETPLPADLENPETPESDPWGIEDERLRLLFICCHPALSPEAQQALALRTLGGLTTREIARAFVEPETTTAQRIVRAKRKIRDARIPYAIPGTDELEPRIAEVLSVIYLIFNEGYLGTGTNDLTRPDLTSEAIRLGRLAVRLLPDHAEARGLLALMLLTDARREARSVRGALVPLEAQDRSRWDRVKIAEGNAILDEALAMRSPGPFQIQAAIAALHSQALEPGATDWSQIASLYRALLQWGANPVVELNAAIATGMAESIDAGLDWIASIERQGALDGYHLLHAARADLLRRAGHFDRARAAYSQALDLVTNAAERRYLEGRLTECTEQAAVSDSESGSN